MLPLTSAASTPTSHLGEAELFTLVAAGDRAAAAEYLRRQERLIRVRAARSMPKRTRRLFDSGDIFSTVARRVDRLVAQDSLRAESEAQFTALLCVMARNCAISKSRIADRLEGCRDEDHEVAEAYHRRAAESPHRDVDAEDVIGTVSQQLHDPLDRQILLLWLQGENHAQIGRLLGIEHATIRQRWTRIRSKLRASLDKAAQ